METLKSHVQGEYALAVSCEKIRDLYSHLRRTGHPDLSPADEFRDISTLTQRYYDEGVGLFTRALPDLDECFLANLTTDDWTLHCFLRPVWEFAHECRTFARDVQDWVPSNNTVQTIKMVRTILKGFKKFELPPTEDQVVQKIKTFLDIEEDITEKSWYFEDDSILFRAQRLMEDFFSGYEPYGKKDPNKGLPPYVPTCHIPRHGPGAVADGKKANKKWSFSTLYESVHQHWPYYDYFFGIHGALETQASYTSHGVPEGDLIYVVSCDGDGDFVTRRHSLRTKTRATPTHLLHCAGWYKDLKRVPTPTSRLVFVPKDSRGPRAITCEPSELMWLQQGVLSGLVRYIERHPLTKGRVNFADQTINAVSASRGARDNSLATIDLKDASDRVSVALVSYLVPERISCKWLALRSTHTILPDGSVHQLAKFAAMGSALCFPVEALVFWSLCVATLEEHGLSREAACANVLVYGDDIIVPRQYAVPVMNALEFVGLEVNKVKSYFGEEYFRESCGTDSFCGEDITPLYQRTPPPSRPSDGNAITSLLAQASELWTWMPATAHFLLRVVEDVLEQPVPRVPYESELLAVVVPPCDAWGIHDWIRTHSVTWDRDRCYLATKALVLKTRQTASPFEDNWSRLLNALTCKVESDPEMVVERSSTQIRRKRVQLPLVVDQSRGT